MFDLTDLARNIIKEKTPVPERIEIPIYVRYSLSADYVRLTSWCEADTTNEILWFEQKITFTPPQNSYSILRNGCIDSLEKERDRLREDTTKKLALIDEKINSLLALEYKQ